ncbi:hypothetical protein PVK06_034908 [Gossypium arboreum]|uniref:Uncharacterized protein n=1 Tax=Gossypium arboreum TaxID=29729 RepID=A0ABR0NFG0_GOSAR|nr:hypothetical protein PVK06_034908 [Gossypium arboreum]
MPLFLTIVLGLPFPPFFLLLPSFSFSSSHHSTLTRHFSQPWRQTNPYPPHSFLDTTTEAASQVAHPSNTMWAYNASNNLATVLIEKKEEPLTSFTPIISSAQSSTPSQTSSSMDVDVLMERAQRVIDTAGTMVQTNGNSHKRLRTEGGSRSTKKSSGSMLVHCRQVKKPINSNRVPTPLVLPVGKSSLENAKKKGNKLEFKKNPKQELGYDI